ncbi:MAG TPA: 4-hydroxythreonine-4-phosphate dehydrogenase PdxA [Candidatus Methylomirabilis sp.]|nr:4-hydroxythreonine-4-phosphate dehydrogenase PdxA [Gemmatimonadales bacterium]HYB44359.1 4-hydroxythreonine-4-phosphate dehydrogenase PdxA [Candidatus Methylomirabilis sp.]
MPAYTPRLAITVGDPRGIGPEVVASAIGAAGVETTVVGPDDVIERIGADHAEGVGRWDGGGGLELAGRLTGRAVEAAVRLWKEGRVDAIVTGPGDKRALNAAGYRFPGHTELLRDLTGAKRVAMMLASDRLRVVLVTTHLALRDALSILTPERIVDVGRVTREFLGSWFGLAEPRLALCALNPHAGEGGLFGHEEARVLAPAARTLGVAGPLPADTVFVRAMAGEFDAVLAPYHDVGMTAIKVASFGHAVNVTLGLPVPRTSPDHGTAMDIAGKGVADPSSMKEAIKVAREIVERLKSEK